MDTELCNDSRCAIAWKRPGPGLVSSKPDQANPGLVKFFISISDPATNTSSNGENLVAFVDYPRLILRNKPAGTFRVLMETDNGPYLQYRRRGAKRT